MVTLDELLQALGLRRAVRPPEQREREDDRGEGACAHETGSYLINVARGKVVDQDALYRALSEKKIAGAPRWTYWPNSPLTPNDPLLKLDNVIFTPHDAAITLETGRYSSVLIANSILDILHGRKPKYPVNLLNPQVAEVYLRKVSSKA